MTKREPSLRQQDHKMFIAAVLGSHCLLTSRSGGICGTAVFHNVLTIYDKYTKSDKLSHFTAS